MRSLIKTASAVVAATALVFGGALTPAQAVSPSIHVGLNGTTLDGSLVDGYDPATVLHATLIAEEGKLHYTDNGSGAMLVSHIGDTAHVITLEGNEGQLTQAFSGISFVAPCTNGSYQIYGQVTDGSDVRDPISGRVFRLVDTNYFATRADAKALATTTPLLDGATDTFGYLPTVTSYLQNDIIASMNPGAVWLGASDATTRFDWVWDSGPESGTHFFSGDSNGQSVNGAYSNWALGEPRNINGDEHNVYQTNDGLWSAVPDSQTMNALIEFGGMPGDNLAATNFSIQNDGVTINVTDGFDQDGTSSNPYQVSSDYQLGLVDHCFAAGVYFLQTNDITITGFPGIGAANRGFVGHYDGGGRQIIETNRVINGDYQGLFNVIGSGGSNPAGNVVENINYQANITQSGFFLNIGALAGLVDTATVNNVSVTGTWSGSGQQIGSIAGLASNAFFNTIYSEMDFNLDSPYNMANIGGLIGNGNTLSINDAGYYANMTVNNGGQYGNSVGGAFGYLSESTVVRAKTNGHLSYNGGGSKIGGLYGGAYMLNVDASRAIGTVEAPNANYVGGFAGGHDGGEVQNSYSENNSVLGFGYTGGMFGSLFNASLHDSYSRSNTESGGGYVGALVADIMSSQLHNIYAIGAVTGPDGDGGWYGFDESGSTASSVFWVPALVGAPASSAPIDGSSTMTADQAVSYDFYVQAGFDISTNGKAGTTWVICPSRNGGFPYLYKTQPNLTCILSFANSPAPTITGSGKVGEPLAAVAGDWDAGVTITYQWKLDGVAIAGATASSYTPTAGQAGKTLTVEVTGAKTSYPSVTNVSSNSIVVLAMPVVAPGGDSAANPALAPTNGSYVTTGDSALSWNRAKGLLGFKILVQYTGPIKATLTFKSGSKNYTCAVSFGILKKQPKFKQTWIKSPNFCTGKKEKTQAAALKKIAANTIVKIVTVRELHNPATYKKLKMKNRTIFVKLG